MNSEKKIGAFTIFEFFMPLLVLVTLVLTEYVTVGAEMKFGLKDITKLIITIVCLICVYLPLKDAFLSVLNEKELTMNRAKEYGIEVTKVHDNHLVGDLAKFCLVEMAERKKRHIDILLENTKYDYESFKEKYKFDKKLVLDDKSLNDTPDAKKCMLRACKEEKKIKAETIDTILPCGSHKGDYKRVKSNSKRTNAFVTSKKMITVILSSFMLVSVTVGMSPDATPIAVATRVMISLTLIIMNSIGAFFAAKSINRAYTEEMYEKTIFLNEFEKWKDFSMDNNNVKDI